MCTHAASSTQLSIADYAKALPLRLAGDVNNDMLPLDGRADHNTLLVTISTPAGIATKRFQSIGVERDAGSL